VSGLLYADGHFPFCVKEADGLWDGETRYMGSPSMSETEDLTNVVGPGTSRPWGGALDEISRLFWRVKTLRYMTCPLDFKINSASFNAPSGNTSDEFSEVFSGETFSLRVVGESFTGTREWPINSSASWGEEGWYQWFEGGGPIELGWRDWADRSVGSSTEGSCRQHYQIYLPDIEPPWSTLTYNEFYSGISVLVKVVVPENFDISQIEEEGYDGAGLEVYGKAFVGLSGEFGEGWSSGGEEWIFLGEATGGTDELSVSAVVDGLLGFNGSTMSGTIDFSWRWRIQEDDPANTVSDIENKETPVELVCGENPFVLKILLFDDLYWPQINPFVHVMMMDGKLFGVPSAESGLVGKYEIGTFAFPVKYFTYGGIYDEDTGERV
jgi:hypothetical protein